MMTQQILTVGFSDNEEDSNLLPVFENGSLISGSNSQTLETVKCDSDRALCVAKDISNAMMGIVQLVRNYNELANDMTENEAKLAFDEVKELTVQVIADAKSAYGLLQTKNYTTKQ